MYMKRLLDAHADLPRIPNNAEGFNLLDGTVWQVLHIEAMLLSARAVFRTMPFPPKILKVFNYVSYLHQAFLSHQNEDSFHPVNRPISIPEKSKQLTILFYKSYVDMA